MPVPTIARANQIVRNLKRKRRKKEANAASSFGSLQRSGVRPGLPRPRLQLIRKPLLESRPVYRWTSLREANTVPQPSTSKGRVYLVTIIAEGLGNHKDMNFYSRNAILTGPQKFNGAKCYADHPTDIEEEILPERSMRDLVGYYTDCRAIQNEQGRAALQGYLHIFPSAKWLSDMIDTILQDPKANDLFGISIYATGKTIPKYIQGIEVNWVEEFEVVTSADVVTEPAARGKFERIVESKTGRMKVKEVTPPGFEDVVQGLKKAPGVDNPWAVAWWMKGQGYEPKKESGAVKLMKKGSGPIVLEKALGLYREAARRKKLQEARRAKPVRGRGQKPQAQPRSLREAGGQLTLQKVKELADELAQGLNSDDPDQLHTNAKSVADELYAVSVGDNVKPGDNALSVKGEETMAKTTKEVRYTERRDEEEARRYEEEASRGKEGDIPPMGKDKDFGGSMQGVPHDAGDEGANVNPDIGPEEEEEEEEAAVPPPMPGERPNLPPPEGASEEEAYEAAQDLSDNDPDMMGDDSYDDDDDDNNDQYMMPDDEDEDLLEAHARYMEARKAYKEAIRKREARRGKEAKGAKESRSRARENGAAAAKDAERAVAYQNTMPQVESKKMREAKTEANFWRGVALNRKKTIESLRSRMYLAKTAQNARRLLREASKNNPDVITSKVAAFIESQLIGLKPEEQAKEINRHILFIEGIRGGGEIDGNGPRGEILGVSAAVGEFEDHLGNWGIPLAEE